MGDIVMFKPLGRGDLTKIVEIQLREPYNPAYGARPLWRWLERVVVTELSRWLIDGRLKEHSKVTISESNGELTFKSEPLPQSQTRQVLSDGPQPTKKRRARSSLSSTDSVLDDAMDCL